MGSVTIARMELMELVASAEWVIQRERAKHAHWKRQNKSNFLVMICSFHRLKSHFLVLCHRQKSHSILYSLQLVISLLTMMRMSAVLYFQSMLIGQTCIITAFTSRTTKHHRANSNHIICLRMYSRSVSVEKKTA